MAGDLETGNTAAESRRVSLAVNEKDAELDEYSNLVRYISTYRDTKGGAAVAEEQEDYDEKKRPWYAFWRKEVGPQGAIDIPAEWLETDIFRGLSSDEVEKRRRKTGYNELADIKENMFLKFIGFFRGPVLYGTFSMAGSMPVFTSSMEHVLTIYLQLWKSPSCSLLVCVLGLISVLLSPFFFLTPSSDGIRRSRPPMSLHRLREISP